MAEFEARPPIAHSPISMVLPVYNTARELGGVVGNWVNCFTGLERDFEIIIVDDGSTDTTPAAAAAVCAKHARVRVLTHPGRQGIGAALRTGLAACQYPLFFYSTCDAQYRAGEFKQLLKAIDQVDVASAFRLLGAAPSWLRRLGWVYRQAIRVLFGITLEPLPGWLGWRNHLYAACIRFWFGVRLRDLNCCFKLFRRSIFEHMPIQSAGTFVHAEILAKANFTGCYLSEVPIACRTKATPGGDGFLESRRQTWADGWRVFMKPAFVHPP